MHCAALQSAAALAWSHALVRRSLYVEGKESPGQVRLLSSAREEFTFPWESPYLPY